MDFNFESLLIALKNFRAQPDFFMLSEKEAEPYSSQEWGEHCALLQAFFPSKSFIAGFRN
jgi:hypothetical protein